jgi:two-component system, response regulator, stage 0 sporulation protein F
MAQNNKNKTGDQKSPVLFNHELLSHLLFPACIMTSKSILIYANDPFMRFFGIDSEEKRFDWPNVVNSEHKKFVGQTLVKAFNGSFSSCVVEVKTGEDESITVEVLMQPVPVNGIINNVMILIRMLDEDRIICRPSIPEQEEFANPGYYEFSPLPLMRFGKDFQILTCSRSFEGTLGYKADELSRKPSEYSSLFKYDSEKIKNHIIEILKGNIPFKRMGEIKVRSRDGDEKIVNIIIYPVLRENEIIAADLIMEDITRVRDLKERLSSAKRLNLVSDIGKGFIHSINNTVNVILNQTQLLQIITEKDTVYDGLKQIEKYVHEIIEQMRRIVGFINEKGDSVEEREESFDSILNDAIEFTKIHFKVEEGKRRRTLTIEKIPGFEMSVKTDTGFLRELLIWAILKVSVYAGKKGKIEVELKKTSFICFNARVNKKDVIDKENIVPFTLDGLSPSEIRGAAEKLNLKILEEESDAQYSIKIIFPQRMVIENKGNLNGEQEYLMEDKDIMVVEDEHALQMILGNYFERLGNRVFITDNGSEAFEEFRRKNYDIVISDYDVSGITGIELSARIKEINEDTLTVLLSGWPLDPKGYTGFIDLFMAKPFNIEDLIKGIARANSTNT